MRRLGILLLSLVLLVLAGGSIALVTGAFDISPAALEAKYRKPESQFRDIDGVRVHYLDEGAGPAVVLVHASFMNLHSWDALAAALRPNYRVVRLDLLAAGLTGPDPTGRYSMDRNIQLLDRLTTELGVERYALIATSSGGTVAFRHAAANPERITRLILINSAGMPRTAATDPNRARGGRITRWVQRYYKSRSYWRTALQQQFTSGMAPPTELVDRVYDMNRRSGRNAEGAQFLRNFKTGDPEKTLARIVAPTLILWGEGNTTVSHLEADVFQLWMTAAPSLKKKYPQVGHYFYLEIPDEANRDIENFLAGQLDDQLRVTRRLPPGPPPQL
ncbi:MAG TPA: alpha/beta hydrolase [Steroidobacteraceae bacterium]|nr:alpha/beta hydrolase [Steroidobacteraceae bacterium]